ncbi:hypothetical protein HDU76_007302, partial [Blyttiomyces sp. JEL0837]
MDIIDLKEEVTQDELEEFRLRWQSELESRKQPKHEATTSDTISTSTTQSVAEIEP